MFSFLTMTAGRHGRALLIAGGMAAASSPAAAQTLDLPGIYGNDTGCHAATTGEYRDDDVLILRPHQIETIDTFCDFTDVRPSPDGASLVSASCASEGMESTHTLKISDPDPENDTVLIFFEDGELWDEISLCS